MKKVNTVLIASGDGTGARAIIRASNSGFIPEVKLKGLISTERGAGCIKMGRNRGVKAHVWDWGSFSTESDFNRALLQTLEKWKVQLVFLVGCIHKIYPIQGIDIYNIHPADIEKHGGNKMYCLAVHEHVLGEVKDLISRGKKKVNDQFYTYPTVHRAEMEFDDGRALLVGEVEISVSLVSDLVEKRVSLSDSAKRLQKIVLAHEWVILPAAVQLAAQRIIARESE